MAEDGIKKQECSEEEVEREARRRGLFVIGLTGPFGSGCSTAAHALSQSDPPFEVVKLSNVLRGIAGDERGRRDLQDLGNDLRRRQGVAALVVKALGDALAADANLERVAIDGIRNLGEARWLQRALGDRFSLFAVTAESKERFERQTDPMSAEQFAELDQRDQEESEDYGQQVNRCVDIADVLIPNERQLEAWEIEAEFSARVRDFAELVQERKVRYASQEEMLMNVAYAASHGSKCLKRQVGCVIAEEGEPLASGYNENPDELTPCIARFGTCYRDIVRHERFVELARDGASCPYCSTPLPNPLLPPWKCACGRSLDAAFFPDRAMKWCTALHAEDRALLNLKGRDASGATLYSTTYPCMLCAEKIIQAGIRDVVFIEAYPDAHAVILFQKSGVQARRFEGVRSRNFERYFGRTQPEMEARGRRKLMEIIGG